MALEGTIISPRLLRLQQELKAKDDQAPEAVETTVSMIKLFGRDQTYDRDYFSRSSLT